MTEQQEIRKFDVEALRDEINLIIQVRGLNPSLALFLQFSATNTEKS